MALNNNFIDTTAHHKVRSVRHRMQRYADLSSQPPRSKLVRRRQEVEEDGVGHGGANPCCSRELVGHQ